MNPIGVCERCGTPSTARIETAAGRMLCRDCADVVDAAAAALLIGAGAGEAVAIHGWRRRVRDALRRGRS